MATRQSVKSPDDVKDGASFRSGAHDNTPLKVPTKIDEEGRLNIARVSNNGRRGWVVSGGKSGAVITR